MNSRGTATVVLTRARCQEKALFLGPAAALLPASGLLFDLWHDGVPWAAQVLREPCDCGHPPGPHHHDLLRCAELQAGLRWVPGARVRLGRDQGRCWVDGDIDP